LSLITSIYGFVIWASKSPRRFLCLRLRFGLKTGGDGFFRFGLKTGGGFLG
jgi:hypothetical protein